MRPPAGAESLLRNVPLSQAPHVLACPARQAPVAVAPDASSSLTGSGDGSASSLGGMDSQHAAFEEARRRGLAEGREQGFEEGRREGLRDAARQVDAARLQARTEARSQADAAAAAHAERWSEQGRRLDQLLTALERSTSEQLQALEGDAIELAFEVVCRLLGEPSSRRSVVESLVRQGFAGLRSQALRVRLHPVDLALIEEHAALRLDHPGVEWLGDGSVASGGCLIDSRKGTLDARLETQLRQLLQGWQGSGLLAGPQQ